MYISKIFWLILLLICLSSCQKDCLDRVGKERFNIETSLEEIDSIEITSNINFQKIFDSDILNGYQSEYVNTDLKKLSIIVYLDNDSTHINIPIKNDHSLYISISTTNSNKCLPELLNERFEWFSSSKGEIQYCYSYGFIYCH
jgi:hypothetical protein